MGDLCPVGTSVVVANGDHVDRCPAFIRQKSERFSPIIDSGCEHIYVWPICGACADDKIRESAEKEGLFLTHG